LISRFSVCVFLMFVGIATLGFSGNANAADGEMDFEDYYQANAGNSSEMTIPDGSYELDNSLALDPELTIKGRAAMSVQITNVKMYNYVFLKIGGKNVTVDGITFNNVILKINNADGITIKDCDFRFSTDFINECIGSIAGSENVRYVNCTFQAVKSDFFISDCERILLSDTELDGVNCFTYRSSDVEISKCAFRNSKINILVEDGKDFQIIDNAFSDSETGISIDSTDPPLISNNRFSNMSIGISLYQKLTNAYLDDNSFENVDDELSLSYVTGDVGPVTGEKILKANFFYVLMFTVLVMIIAFVYAKIRLNKARPGQAKKGGE